MPKLYISLNFISSTEKRTSIARGKILEVKTVTGLTACQEWSIDLLLWVEQQEKVGD
jgi:hypothetical protein